MVNLNSDQIKDIAALREKMQERVVRLHKDMEETNLCITVMDMVLKRSSFTRASEYVSDDTSTTRQEAGEEPSVDASQADIATKLAVESVTGSVAEKTTKPEDMGPIPKDILSVAGDTIIGTILVQPDSIVITLDKNVSISPEAPPFKTFFLDRILAEMTRKDSVDVRAGRISIESIISYKVETTEGRLDRIIITNYRTDDRAQEIDSSSRWVLNRMLEHAR